MSALTVGLTGGLASGKSTVAGWLREAGFEVIDADHLVAQLYAPGGPGSRIVSEIFGSAALDAEGGVDHQYVSRRVFNDESARRRLEEVIHPLVRGRFRDIAANTERVAVLEATLLVEAGLASEFDLLVTVEADPETRVARAVGRGMSAAAARERLAAQGTGVSRRSAADIVIENHGSREDLHRQAGELIQEIERRVGDDAVGSDSHE